MRLINHASGFDRYVANSLVRPACTLGGRYSHQGNDVARTKTSAPPLLALERVAVLHRPQGPLPALLLTQECNQNVKNGIHWQQTLGVRFSLPQPRLRKGLDKGIYKRYFESVIETFSHLG
jgi:hypothetical protein